MFRARIALISVLAVSMPALAAAQWMPNGTPVCTATGKQTRPAMIADGAGGAIIVWQDGRYGTNTTRIFAQRVDASGFPLWTPGGILVCTFSSNQLTPSIVSDGAGGAIVAWHDARNVWYDIFAQRVNAAGMIQWDPWGVQLCGQGQSQFDARLATDGAGGAIVSWDDYRNGVSNRDIFVQRVSAAGLALWAIDGVPVCTAAGEQRTSRLVADGSGGAIVTWHDDRTQVFAQRLDASGAVQWAPDGVVVCSTCPVPQADPNLASDGTGGAVLVFKAGSDVYAQRVDALGALQWTNAGVAVCTEINSQYSPVVIPDGLGGFIAAWHDNRLGFSNPNLHAQRLTANGAPLWAPGGPQVSSAPGAQELPSAVDDGAGGLLVAWTDWRSPTDVYAQHLDGTGAETWADDGEPLCTAAGNQAEQVAISDGSGGLIVAWPDPRSMTTDSDIYALRRPSAGAASVGGGSTADRWSLSPSAPNPARGAVHLTLRIPGACDVEARVLDVAGRTVSTLARGRREPGVHPLTWNGRDWAGKPAASGVYLVVARAGELSATRKVLLLRD